MPKEFATTVVLDETHRQVLLFLREDFRLWTLPGGHIEAGETPEQAAVRETLEETGYQVTLGRYAGRYYRPQFKDVRHTYRASVTGGQPITNGPETVMVKWFPIEALPPRCTPFLSQIVRDGLAEAGQPVERIQRFPTWQVALIGFMVRLRDLRNWVLGR